jgi:hypothetical protein
MAMGRREKDIKLLVAKFVKLVESLNPGERLTIRKVAAKKRPATKVEPRKVAGKGRKAAVKALGSAPSTKASR